MHLVGLYTYCGMMHGAYSVKFGTEYFPKVNGPDSGFDVPRSSKAEVTNRVEFNHHL